MIRTYNIRFNRLNPQDPNRWVVEDSATHLIQTASHIDINVPTQTVEDHDRTVYSIQATGVLVWSGQAATIK